MNLCISGGRRLAAAAVTLACVGGALTACSSSRPQATSSPKATHKAAVVMPLTGESADAVPAHPAVSVKIPADMAARPQRGLTSADNVWVELVEGGEVRYDAVFFSNLAEKIGPIRSVRPVDVPINAPLHGVLLASGGQPDFLTKVGEGVGKLLVEDTAGDATWRTRERRMPYNLYGSAKLAAERAGDLKAPPAQWQFGKATGGQAVTEFTATYPSWKSGWTWSGSAWQRSDNGKPTSDIEGPRVEAADVVVLKVATKETQYLDPIGNPVVDTVFEGSGEARLARDGKVWEATWHKAAAKDPVTLTGADGKKLALAKGKVWIELVPDSATWFASPPAPQESGSATPTTSSNKK